MRPKSGTSDQRSLPGTVAPRPARDRRRDAAPDDRARPAVDSTSPAVPVVEPASSGGRRLLLGLLAGDAAFTLLTVVQLVVPGLEGDWAGMGTDGSPAEWFQYGKALAAAVLLARIAVDRRWPVHAFWAAVMLLLMLDDSLRLHERIGGRWIGERLLPWGSTFSGYHGGQFVYAAIVGAAIAVGGLVCLWRGSARARRLTWTLLGVIGLLGASGVGVDWVAGHASGGLKEGLSLLEEVGEHVALSLALWIAWRER